jgi:CubicO group peptidase (beta-lactamase class C family)
MSLNLLEERIRLEQKSGKLKEVGLVVCQSGKVLYRLQTGDIQEDTIFRLFSMTKPITALLTAVLVDRNLLSWDSKVSDWFPEFNNLEVLSPNGREVMREPITVQHLINMTSGFCFAGEERFPGKELQAKLDKLWEKHQSGTEVLREEIIHAFAQYPLQFQPGTRWHYSSSADFLSLLIEKVSGESYESLMRKEVLDPLGMESTGYVLSTENEERLAKMYTVDNSILREATLEELHSLHVESPGEHPLWAKGGSGLYSTVDDYLRFALYLLDNGKRLGIKLIRDETWQYLRTPNISESVRATIDFDSLKGYSYSNLFRILVKPECLDVGSFGEFGWDGLAGCYFFVDPKKDLVFVYMQQLLTGADQTLRNDMRRIIYKNI